MLRSSSSLGGFSTLSCFSRVSCHYVPTPPGLSHLAMPASTSLEGEGKLPSGRGMSRVVATVVAYGVYALTCNV